MSGYYPYGQFDGAFYGGTGAAAGLVIAVMILLMLLVVAAVSILFYVFHSLGLYTTAKRRGIHNPWLAWIPIGREWILGSISDQYQYVTKGKVRNLRKVLLGLQIAITILTGPYMVMTTIGRIYAGSHGLVAPLLAAAFAVIAVSITAMVIRYICYFDLFRSSQPGNEIPLLVLAILVNVSLPIIVFLCRKKDDGMPPRRTQPQQAPVEQIPQEVTAEPSPEESEETLATPEDFEDVEPQEEPTEE